MSLNEGLTIYLADHFLEEQKEAGWQCRRRILSNFKSHVNARNEIPLRKFSEREDDVARSVGYGKSAMAFHMLRRLVGEENFFAGIRDFVWSQHPHLGAKADGASTTARCSTPEPWGPYPEKWCGWSMSSPAVGPIIASMPC